MLEGLYVKQGDENEMKNQPEQSEFLIFNKAHFSCWFTRLSSIIVIVIIIVFSASQLIVSSTSPWFTELFSVLDPMGLDIFHPSS